MELSMTWWWPSCLSHVLYRRILVSCRVCWARRSVCLCGLSPPDHDVVWIDRSPEETATSPARNTHTQGMIHGFETIRSYHTQTHTHLQLWRVPADLVDVGQRSAVIQALTSGQSDLLCLNLNNQTSSCQSIFTSETTQTRPMCFNSKTSVICSIILWF